MPQLHQLIRTPDSWRDELQARFVVDAISNRPTKAVNSLLDKIKRVRHGFRHFTNR